MLSYFGLRNPEVLPFHFTCSLKLKNLFRCCILLLQSVCLVLELLLLSLCGVPFSNVLLQVFRFDKIMKCFSLSRDIMYDPVLSVIFVASFRCHCALVSFIIKIIRAFNTIIILIKFIIEIYFSKLCMMHCILCTAVQCTRIFHFYLFICL